MSPRPGKNHFGKTLSCWRPLLKLPPALAYTADNDGVFSSEKNSDPMENEPFEKFQVPLLVVSSYSTLPLEAVSLSEPGRETPGCFNPEAEVFAACWSSRAKRGSLNLSKGSWIPSVKPLNGKATLLVVELPPAPV